MSRNLEFRVWFIINPGTMTDIHNNRKREVAYIKVTTLEEALVALRTFVKVRQHLEELDPYQIGQRIWTDDVSGLEYRDLDNLPTEEDIEDGLDPEGWIDWHDKEGEDIDYYFNVDPDEYGKPFEEKLVDITQ